MINSLFKAISNHFNLQKICGARWRGSPLFQKNYFASTFSNPAFKAATEKAIAKIPSKIVKTAIPYLPINGAKLSLLIQPFFPFEK